MSDDDKAEAIRLLRLVEEDSLSDWEAEFIDSISQQIESNVRLTDRQWEKLEEIADRAPF